MQVQGTGLKVSLWYMTAGPYFPGQCAYGAYWIDGGLYALGKTVCNKTTSDLMTYVSQLLNQNQTFTKNVTACNSAVNLSGYPCEGIHK